MHQNTKKLVFVIGILIAFIYIRYYTSVVKEIRIIQLPIADLVPSLLRSKNPIIIEDRLVHPLSLLHTVFKYMYITKNVVNSESANTKFIQNKARFFILCSKNDNNSVDIVNPNFITNTTSEPPFVEVKLHANMCMILPNKWYYRLQVPVNFSSIALHDFVSLTFGKFL